MCTDIYIHTLTSMYTDIYVHLHLCTLTSMYTYIYVHWHQCTPTSMYTDIYVHWHLCVPTSMCTDIYVHWHLCRYTNKPFKCDVLSRRPLIYGTTLNVKRLAIIPKSSRNSNNSKKTYLLSPRWSVTTFQL